MPPLRYFLILLTVGIFLFGDSVTKAQNESTGAFSRGSILKRNNNQSAGQKPDNSRRQNFARPKVNNQNIQMKNFKPIQPRLNAVQTKKSTIVLNKIEAIFGYISQGILILGCALGGPVMLFGFVQLAIGANDGIIKVVLGLFGIIGGLITPMAIDWLFSYARNSSMF